MKLVLLGTGGYYGNDRRQTACLMLPEVGVILDAGSGLYRIRDRVATDELTIFLTHAHLDHTIGLTYLLDVLSPETLGRTTVFGEPSKLAAVREHLFSDDLFPVLPPIRFEPIRPVHSLAGGGKLTHFPLTHPGGSIGFRLNWPEHSLAYVTDTTADAAADYVEQIRGVDLLVHEAYFLHDEHQWSDTVGHSCVENVARVAARAQVGRLVLVHMSPQLFDDVEFDLTAARRIFPATELGHDGLELKF
jgi:ribonuclease BN (tRNA processing enzyme)